jgi:hypothetical protein
LILAKKSLRCRSLVYVTVSTPTRGERPTRFPAFLWSVRVVSRSDRAIRFVSHIDPSGHWSRMSPHDVAGNEPTEW